LPRLTKAWRLTPFPAPPSYARGAGGGRGLELHLGRWYNGNRADVYELRTTTRLGGPFTHGFGLTLLVNDTLGRRRAFYGLGYEMQVGRGRATLGPYAAHGTRAGTFHRHVHAGARRSVDRGRRARMAAALLVCPGRRAALSPRGSGPERVLESTPRCAQGRERDARVSFGLGSRAGGSGGVGTAPLPTCRRRCRPRPSPATRAKWCRRHSKPWGRRTSGAVRPTTGSIVPDWFSTPTASTAFGCRA